MKKNVSIVFSLIGIVCILYYTSRFYMQNNLFFGENLIGWWTFLSVIILISLGLGIFNTLVLSKVSNQVIRLTKENAELKTILVDMCNKFDKNTFSIIHEIKNSEDISLDILEKLRDECE